LTGWKCGLFST